MLCYIAFYKEGKKYGDITDYVCYKNPRHKPSSEIMCVQSSLPSILSCRDCA